MVLWKVSRPLAIWHVSLAERSQIDVASTLKTFDCLDLDLASYWSCILLVLFHFYSQRRVQMLLLVFNLDKLWTVSIISIPK